MSDKTETRTASSTGGEKGVKLARYDLLPVGPLQEVAERFGLGAMKYENRNWERGYEWSKSYGALQRHLNAFWSGEEDDDLGEEAFRAAGLDPEDFKVDGRIPGSSHLAAAACHCLFLLEWAATHPEFDDRVSTERSRKESATEHVDGIRQEFYFPALECHIEGADPKLVSAIIGRTLPGVSEEALRRLRDKRNDLTAKAVEGTVWVTPTEPTEVAKKIWDGVRLAPAISVKELDDEDGFTIAREQHRAKLLDWHGQDDQGTVQLHVTGQAQSVSATIDGVEKRRVDDWLKEFNMDLLAGDLGDPHVLISREEFSNRVLNNPGVRWQAARRDFRLGDPADQMIDRNLGLH